LNVGAGTVCNNDELNKAIDAGAQFIVSPLTDVAMIESCVAMETPIFPGAFTPTEIYRAWSAGARMVKLFPAGLLGPSYIKDVLAPLNQVEIMPTGGVSIENISDYRNAGVKAFGMGSLLFNKDLINRGDWEGLKEHLIKVKESIE
jgi:2-dehydro-3-deoxyphosphogluconate aldolase / (4S)-4-hydroxy-2-oxoglutarate aldolase